MQEGDLVFADPPYSGVHYSRFYHVLETLCNGKERTVSGRGRYPAPKYRPVSAFSRKSESLKAANDFLKSCAEKQLNIVLTFPASKSSNGLGSEDFIDLGKRLFSSVEMNEVETNFSTLGGNKKHRSPRKLCKEAVLSFRF